MPHRSVTQSITSNDLDRQNARDPVRISAPMLVPFNNNNNNKLCAWRHNMPPPPLLSPWTPKRLVRRRADAT